MQEKKTQSTHNNSLKTAAIYIAGVIVLLILAVIVRILFLIAYASFDNKHQFVIAVVKNMHMVDVVVLSPDGTDNQKIHVAHVHDLHNPSEVRNELLIPVD